MPSNALRSPLAFARTAAVVCTLAGCGAKTGLDAPSSDAAPHSARDASRAEPDVVERVDGARRSDVPEGTARDIAAALDGLRWELPCERVVNSAVCTTAPSRAASTTLRGPPGERYRVTLRIRGVVELKTYVGGSNDGGHWQIGGAPRSDNINVYGLAVSSPPQQYYLNRVTREAFACFALDYEATMLLDTGARVSLDATSVDGRQARNVDTAGRPIVVPAVAPAPAPFDGQFIQMDVVAIERVR